MRRTNKNITLATQNRRAFTLIEALLSLALFAFASVVISQVCYNCLYSFDISDKNAIEDSIKDQFVDAIMSVTDYESLDDGVEIEALDGETYTITAEAKPTKILNLFELSVTAQKGMKELKTTIFVARPNSWYEQPNERSDMLEDRTDFLEKERRQKGTAMK